MLRMLQHFARLMRSVGPPQVWMVEKGKVSGRLRMMEEAKHPGIGCGCLPCYWSSPQHTAAGCWAGTNCSPSPPPERDQSETFAQMHPLMGIVIMFYSFITCILACFLALALHIMQLNCCLVTVHVASAAKIGLI